MQFHHQANSFISTPANGVPILFSPEPLLSSADPLNTDKTSTFSVP